MVVAREFVTAEKKLHKITLANYIEIVSYTAALVLKQKNKSRIVIKWMIYIYNQTHCKLLEIVVC